MFSLFEQCAAELERMKTDGTYVERHTESGRLAAENGVESHFADLPLVYGIIQTPIKKDTLPHQAKSRCRHAVLQPRRDCLARGKRKLQQKRYARFHWH